MLQFIIGFSFLAGCLLGIGIVNISFVDGGPLAVAYLLLLSVLYIGTALRSKYRSAASHFGSIFSFWLAGFIGYASTLHSMTDVIEVGLMQMLYMGVAPAVVTYVLLLRVSEGTADTDD